MWVVTGWIGGDGDSCRWKFPEFLLVNPVILTASFNKHCCWPWPSDNRLLWAGCSCGLDEPLVLVSPYLEMPDSVLKISCLPLTQLAPRDLIVVSWINDPWRNLLDGLLACKDWYLPCWYSRESPISVKKTYLYDTYHKGDIILVTLKSVQACFSIYGEEELFFHCQRGSAPYLMMGLDRMDLDREERSIFAI